MSEDEARIEILERYVQIGPSKWNHERKLPFGRWMFIESVDKLPFLIIPTQCEHSWQKSDFVGLLYCPKCETSKWCEDHHFIDEICIRCGEDYP